MSLMSFSSAVFGLLDKIYNGFNQLKRSNYGK